MSDVVPAAGIITFRVHEDGPRFLLLRNARHGTWGFPKGHREPDEEDRACALREYVEETRLGEPRLIDRFREVTRYPVQENGHEATKEVVYFLGESKAGTPHLSPEHDRFAWMTAEEAIDTLQFEDLKNLVRQAAAHLSEMTP